MNPSKWWPGRPDSGRWLPAGVLPALLAILLLPGVAHGQRSLRTAVSDSGVALHDGVVLAPRHGLAYVMRAGGGIDAVELAGGAVRWHSDSAVKPVALAGDRLVAQAESRGAGALDLVFLDARSGAARDTVRMALPAGVVATAVDTPAGSFRVHAAAAGSQLTVNWEAAGLSVGGPAQGYLPAENEGQAPATAGSGPNVVSGQAVIDLSGSSLRATAHAVRSGPSGPVRPGLEELRVSAGSGADARQFLSADGRHVLTTEPVRAAEFTLHAHRWTVSERASGSRLGAMQALVSAAPFLVVDTTLYHVAPAHVFAEQGRLTERTTTLRAVNLSTGAEAWTKAVRETSFRGPFPP